MYHDSKSLAERRRPGPDRDLRAGLGERLGDRETEAAVVCDAGHQRVLSLEVDRQHAVVIARNHRGINRRGGQVRVRGATFAA